MKDFYNKVVVITGAGSGMGRAYALAFAHEGAKLVLVDIDSDDLLETESLCTAVAPKMQSLRRVVDVANATQMHTLAEAVEAHFGGADILINNAGIDGMAAPAWKIDDDSLRRVMDVNFFGVRNGCQAFLGQMLGKSPKVIVNVASIFGLIAPPNHADYAAAKHAVVGYTRVLRTELSRTNVRVMLLIPGGVNTRIARNRPNADYTKFFLTELPGRVAERVMRGIRRGEREVLIGKHAFRAWFGARFAASWLVQAIYWRVAGKATDMTHYPPSDIERP
ncbi:MAG: SDR family oxidoreductase [Gammaproteobacteria bacterium]|nr:SDR family oxidoreductase [Gammaproteobacteria bacterium]